MRAQIRQIALAVWVWLQLWSQRIAAYVRARLWPTPDVQPQPDEVEMPLFQALRDLDLAAGPVGSVWSSGSWSDTCWEANTWANAVAPTGGRPSASRYRSRYRTGYVVRG